MPLHLYYDKDNIVRMVSTDKLITNRYTRLEYNHEHESPNELIGKKIEFGGDKGVRLAVICNWNDQCGISTYTRFLINSLAPKVNAIKIFSEDRNNLDNNSKLDIEYVWKRGSSMIEATNKVLSWKPTVIMIQHEFGLFPTANYFLPMMERLSSIPTLVTLHSVYEHRDKSVCSSIMKNVVVHSQTGKECLRNTLHHDKQNVWVIPHGCVDYGDVKQNWNFFGVLYPLIQFGFGFRYKGVDIALEAIAKLKKADDKFKDIFYCYLCSENKHVKNAIDNYYNEIKDKIKHLKLENNASIQRGFFNDEELNQYLRTARLAIFPYVTDPDNVVYGASGAIRIAMANNIPVIASKSHMFDDMEGILPRPTGVDETANAIAKVFTDDNYRSNLLSKQRSYIKNNTWEITAQRYYNVLREILDTNKKDVIFV